MSNPSVLIVILNYNGLDVLEDCIVSIEKNTNYSNFDSIVVDNNSTDGSSEIANERNVKLKQNDRNLGFDIGNNIAMYENPEYDYYMLLNNDTEVKENWLTHLVETAEKREKIGIVGPKVLDETGEIQSAGFKLPQKQNLRKGLKPEEFTVVEEADAIHGCAMLISSNVRDQIGYLDEIFSLANNEEWDYCNRAKKSGFQIAVDGRSEIIHKEDVGKEQLNSEISYLLAHKNKLKYEIMNGTIRDIITGIDKLLRRTLGSLIGYKYNPRKAIKQEIKELLIDTPTMLQKRYNRTQYIPSYYTEKNRDYSKRYQDFI